MHHVIVESIRLVVSKQTIFQLERMDGDGERMLG